MRQPPVVYISLLRTGSRSIRTALFGEAATSGGPPCYWNCSLAEVEADFDSRGWAWKDTFKFAVVRNPWERLVSAYEFWWPRAHTRLGLSSPHRRLGFSEWVNTLVERQDPEASKLLEQRPFLSRADGALGIDEVIRFDSLAESWTGLRRRGLVVGPLSRAHRTVHRHYSRYYSAQLARALASRFEMDCDAFGFRFVSLGQRETQLDELRFACAWSRQRAKQVAVLGKRKLRVLLE